MLHRLAKPWITAAALFGLIGSICALDISKLSGSSIGRWVHNLTPDYARIDPRVADLLVVVKASGEARALTDSADSGDLDTSQLYMASWSFRPFHTGIFGLTRETLSFNVRIIPAIDGTPDNLEHRHKVRSAFVDAMAATKSLDTATIAELASGDHNRSRILWLGWAHNALALLSLIILPLSLGWIPGAWRRWRESRRAPGLCAACGYDLHGLIAKVCPECGNRITPP